MTFALTVALILKVQKPERIKNASKLILVMKRFFYDSDFDIEGESSC